MNTTAAVLVTLAATHTSEHVPANRLAVAPAVFARLCRESGIGGVSDGAHDQLHITTTGDDADDLNALDDMFRERAQTVGEFVGGECVVLLSRQGIDGCDVWGRCTVEEIVEPQTVAELLA